MLLGRDLEVGADAALAAAEAGRGSILFIGGEPGVGKTRLATAAAAGADASGVRILWGRCREEGGTPAHWPWVQVLRALAEDTEAQLLADAIGGGAAFLTAAVPELGERLGAVAQDDTSVGAAARFAFFDAVETFLRKLSGAAPADLDDRRQTSSLELLGSCPQLCCPRAADRHLSRAGEP
jgi:hypothetical protein